MKILVLGGDGMLGHQLLQLLATRHEVRVTLRQEFAAYASCSVFSPSNAFAGVDVRVSDRVLAVLSEFHPDAVVNAVGIVKQRPDGLDVIPNLEINALLPHRLALICRATGSRFIHISTDCVFSGSRGHYREEDRPDPVDIYGHSKLLGEVAGEGAITLRTSIIGLGLFRKTSLIDWFMRQNSRIYGYRNAIFSGFTTKELSRVIEKLLVEHPEVSGLYHLSSAPTSKYELLVRLRDKLGLKTDIQPDDDFRCDRSLDSTRFRKDFSYMPPSWDDMLEELANDIRNRTNDISG
jgi:dTDP-4-dehydrorhamnose reductase